ncbi:MAG: gliding motility-associated C-terminal domain-containing protein [Flavobacteriales bacterium]|nr:gliding motility-associated C-terminal domain-containing protein [Flavobacteriales bacterium]
MFKWVFSSLVVLFMLSSCGKHKYKSECCIGRTELTVVPSNMDSVYMIAPNPFSPNGDGINDIFTVFTNGIDPYTFQLTVLKNRDRIFYTNDIGIYWDGTSDGKLQKPGIYSFICEAVTRYGEIIETEGEFCLMDNDNTAKVKNCNTCYFSDMFDPREGKFIYETNEMVSCNN